MRDRDVGLVPVVSDTTSMALMGVITDRDIAVRHVADVCPKDCSVATHMSRDNIETVEENDDSATVLAAMRRREVRRVPVTNRNGKLVGVIAQADIATTRELRAGRTGVKSRREVSKINLSSNTDNTRRGRRSGVDGGGADASGCGGKGSVGGGSGGTGSGGGPGQGSGGFGGTSEP